MGGTRHEYKYECECECKGECGNGNESGKIKRRIVSRNLACADVGQCRIWLGQSQVPLGRMKYEQSSSAMSD